MGPLYSSACRLLTIFSLADSFFGGVQQRPDFQAEAPCECLMRCLLSCEHMWRVGACLFPGSYIKAI